MRPGLQTVSKEGKQRSGQNAITHGLLAKASVVHGETLGTFDKFRTNIFDDLKPEGAMEGLLVEKIANYAWRLRRAGQAEAEMMHKGLSKDYSPKSLDSFFDGWDGKKLNNISRYEAMLAKHFYRAIKELREIQSDRKQNSQDLFDVLGNGFVS